MFALVGETDEHGIMTVYKRGHNGTLKPGRVHHFVFKLDGWRIKTRRRSELLDQLWRDHQIKFADDGLLWDYKNNRCLTVL